ncbi:two-component response regulator-like PRR73 isoform X2 [Zingiber officinale]|uniref:two-component response regulator-like PRR73 isoform X2 n=1 Tax=Zingiber officinale TaxID=94328 RepID=UPI001C4ADDC5|nr:two-component response regulator-like PRR73 isoform X2 [Zingiber officinale]
MGTMHQVSFNGVEQRNQHILYEREEVRDGVLRKGKGISEHDNSRNNVAIEDLKGTHQAGLQEQPEQPPEPIVRWERFLPVRSLKVLLVENDDSTRQVVTALLRNCSYEVTVAANGLQAWKILEDLSNHIDLVLTEVFMSDLCGVALLSKIMNHKTCNNIPVIMMSSNDSMGTVFKCLSKGAVDFLVKPIRKNELKNLWQHVWRRLQSYSGSGDGGGSGSESGIQTQKSAKSRSPVDSKTKRSNAEDNGCNDLNATDGSENGSGIQSSYIKRAMEVDSLQHMSPQDQIADSPDSTCAQVIHPNPGTFCNDWVPISSNGGRQGQKELTDEIMGKDLKIGVPIIAEIRYETHPRKVMNLSKQRDMNEKKLLDSDQNQEIPTLESNNVSTSDERSTKTFDLIGAMANNLDTHPLSALQVPEGLSKIPECQEKTTDNLSDLPNLELSLKRLRARGECGSSATLDDRNVLRRSEQSAFSRYHKSAGSNQAPTGCGGSCSPPDNSSEAMRAESIYNMISNSNVDLLKQGSNGSSNNNDMGTTTRNNSIYNAMTGSSSAPLKSGSAGSSNKNATGSTINAFTQPEANTKETASTFVFNCIQTTAVPLHKQIRTSTNQQIVHEKTEEPQAAGVTRQARGIEHQVQVQHHHHHHHHHHLHVRSMSQQKQQQQQQPPDLDDLQPKMASPALQCWLSNAFVGPVEETSRPGGGNASGSGVVQIRIAQREAALKKFREKRTERNFIKKVRYQSRKILAEQRPRVRGQFVRKTVCEQNNEMKES